MQALKVQGPMGDKARFLKEAREVVETLPGFVLDLDSDAPVLKGSIAITSEPDGISDVYQLHILQGAYPERYPKVFEVGGKIPRNIEWHIYPAEGNCCIAIPPEERIRCIQGIDLITFITEVLPPYFYNQTYRRINGFFLQEYRHGLFGVLDYYAEVLKADSIKEILRLLALIAQYENRHRNTPCFCGSSKKFKDCHRRAYQHLAPLGAEFLKQQCLQILGECLENVPTD